MRRLILPFILLLSVLVRVYDLKNLPNGLYWDEQDTTYQAYSLLTTGRDYHGNAFPLFPHSFADYRTPINIYFTVPLVKLFGLTYLPSRLTATIFGLLTIPIVYFLAKILQNKKTLPPRLGGSWRGVGESGKYLATLFIAFSPWHILFSRYNGEITAMLFFIFAGLLLHFRKKPFLSILFFVLSVASYSPAKLFTPILVITLYLPSVIASLAKGGRGDLLFRFKGLLRFTRNDIFLPLLFFIILISPLVFSKLGSSRFHDLSIFTDPQLASTVDYQRKLRLLTRDPNPPVGSQPSLADKIFVNKYTLLSQRFINNYLANFSTEFLFISGDKNLRHSVSHGQMYPVDAILLIIGFILTFKHSHFKFHILLMLVLAAIPSALTRDGAAHAGRSALLLIPFTIIISQIQIPKGLKIYSLIPIYIIFVLNFIQHFYSYYRLTSAHVFDFGYDQAIELAKGSKMPQVWLDFHNDSPLMSYLFYAQVPPKDFQSNLPLKSVDLGQGIAAYKFGNVYTLLPGERNYSVQIPPKDTLVITKTEKQPALISYPDGLPEFQVFMF